MSTKDKLIIAVTEWDRRQSRTRFYNANALGIYFERVDEVCADIERGASVRQAVIAGFCDRLRDFILKQLSEPIATQSEIDGGAICYVPVKGQS